MTWTLKAPIPGMGDNAVRELGCATIGSKLYVAGGFDIDGITSDLFWEWDRGANSWTSRHGLNGERQTHGCAAIGSKLYVFGGTDNGGTVLSSLHEWNQVTNAAWAAKAAGTARTGLTLTAVGTDLFAFGGSSTLVSADASTTARKWHQASNAWSNVASLPAARWLHAAVRVGTDIWLLGGLDSTGTPVDDVWVYDTIGDSWDTTPAPLPTALFALGAAAINGKLYVVGGVGATDLYEYDPGTDTWTDLTDPLPVVRAYAGVVSIGTYLYVAAGDEGGHKDTLYQWGTATATGGPTDGGKVWAIRSSSDADEWWAGDGTSDSGTTSPLPSDRFNYAGASNGRSIYYLTIDDDAGGQWWVDVYDTTRTTLTDRWEITGWTSAAAATPYYSAFSDIQHCTANATYVAVFAEAESAGNGTGVDSIDVTVFATDGTLLDQWTITSPDRLSGFTGSCIDAAGNLYFGRVDDATSDEKITAVDLTSGTATDLFTINDVDSVIIAVDGSWSGLGATFGLVEIDGDLIIAGAAGLVRVQQDGTPVWWQAVIDPASFGYYALAHSGRGSVWAANSGLYTADEFQYDGTYVQTITLPEPAVQAWLVAARRGGWRFGISF